MSVLPSCSRFCQPSGALSPASVGRIKQKEADLKLGMTKRQVEEILGLTPKESGLEPASMADYRFSYPVSTNCEVELLFNGIDLFSCYRIKELPSGRTVYEFRPREYLYDVSTYQRAAAILNAVALHDIRIESQDASEAYGKWLDGVFDILAKMQIRLADAIVLKSTAKVTIVRPSMSGLELLNEICRQAGLTWHFRDRTIVLEER